HLIRDKINRPFVISMTIHNSSIRFAQGGAPLAEYRLRTIATMLLLHSVLSINQATAAHAVALFGEPGYPAGFSHFDYVNPTAPKGGSLTLSLVTLNSRDRKSTRLNSSHVKISYAVFCLKK